ncbi:hypothetical protein CBOM_05069 [Ceraceosorus bombacis]|uniref:FHA domain-containing protein n=1 Tax=Ceraceosorus bombacis TaxID=401625 RepID=A0A0P1BHN2_9BASI|nr:hypothetical protein CBOM_05069 [Ceraceosorus bombacis]
MDSQDVVEAQLGGGNIEPTKQSMTLTHQTKQASPLSQLPRSQPLSMLDANVDAARQVPTTREIQTKQARDSMMSSDRSSPPPSSPPSLAHGLSSPPSSVFAPSSPSKLEDASSPPPKATRYAQETSASEPHATIGFGLSETCSGGRTSVDSLAGMRSLPPQDPAGAPSLLLLGSYDHALLLGRTKQGPDGSSPVPPPLPLSSKGLGAKPAQFVPLPSSARHVSRVHAIVEWLPFPISKSSAPSNQKGPLSSPPLSDTGCFIIRILGQNGLVVDGKRRREGQVIRLRPARYGLETSMGGEKEAAARSVTPSASGEEGSLLDFFGTALRFAIDDRAKPPPSARKSSSNADTNRGRLNAAPAQLSLGNGQLVDVGDAEQPRYNHASEAQDGTSPQSAKRTRPPALAEDSQSGVSSSDSELSEAESDRATATPENPSDAQAATAKPTGTRQKKRARFVLPASESKRDMKLSSGAPRRSLRAATQTTEVMPGSRSASPSGAQGPSSVSLARNCIAALAPSYDIDGLLASAIVFHRTATISATEACRSVLSSTPGLLRGQVGPRAPVTVSATADVDVASSTVVLSAGQVHPDWPSNEAGQSFERFARKAWVELLESVLHSPDAPQFGTIQRAGKDSAGNPLENWFYYDKEKDGDRDRAESLGAFVKPIRQALKTQKAVFWKKVILRLSCTFLHRAEVC